MNIVVRNIISSKLKNCASEIDYYSNTNRCHALNKKLNNPYLLNLRIYTFEKTS